MRSLALALSLALSPAIAFADACPPPGETAATLAALKAGGFAIEDAGRRQALALALLPCLSHPDPALRDGIGFEAWSTWLRAGALDAATRAEAIRRLLPQLTAPDGAGFGPPFAALVLSELARAEARDSQLDADALQDFAARAAAYLREVRDYRGFDPAEGWRHGVAHGADLVLQLSQHPTLDRAALDALADAIATQVAPTGHSYLHGEAQRLARALYFIARRGLHSESDWTAWLERLTHPAPLPDWNAAYTSLDGLARRHDLVAFLDRLYVLAREGGDAAAEAALRPGVVAALGRVR